MKITKRAGTAIGGGVALAALAALISVTPAAAAPAIQIRRVTYNSPGTDNWSNTSLNAEWISLINRSSTAKRLTGWTIRDKAGHVYRFPTYTLPAGKYMAVHTGRGTNNALHLYWRSGNYIWNNTGDKAYVRNANGTLVDTCSWGRTGSYTNCR